MPSCPHIVPGTEDKPVVKAGRDPGTWRLVSGGEGKDGDTQHSGEKEVPWCVRWP